MSLQRFYIDASTSFPPPLGPKLCLHGDQDWSSTTNTTLRCHLKVDRCDSVLSEPPPDNIEPRERWEVLKRCRPSRSVWSSPQKVGRQVDHHLGPAGWRFSGPPALLPAQSQSVAADCCDVALFVPRLSKEVLIARSVRAAAAAVITATLVRINRLLSLHVNNGALVCSRHITVSRANL